MLDEIGAFLKESGLITSIYKDLAQPGVQQLGKAIGTLLGLGNTALWRAEILNEKSRAIVQANVDAYHKRLETAPLDTVAAVPSEVGVPLLETLGYVSDSILRDAFVSLLEKASLHTSQDLAHPSFPW